MSISLGSSTISNIYLGSNTVTAAYLGSTQVFSGVQITLPTGAVLVYDLTTASCWPGSGSFVYDLSGNGFTGSLYGTIGSGSSNGISFESSEAVLECTSSAFTASLGATRQLYVNVQYQTGSFDKLTTLASTWDGTPDIGYVYFLSVTGSRLDTGVQTYLDSNGVSGESGSYAISNANVAITGSSPHNYEMMANITSGSYTISIDNNLKLTKSNILPTSRWLVYGGSPTIRGKGMRFGNRSTGQNFLGKISKVVVYNRALTADERTTINDWMNQ